MDIRERHEVGDGLKQRICLIAGGTAFSSSGPANKMPSCLTRLLRAGVFLTVVFVVGPVNLPAQEVGERFRDCPACPDMVVVPAGSFTMGAPAADGFDDEHPTLDVRIPEPFAIGAAEVTRGAFARFVDATGYVQDDSPEGMGGCEWRDPGFRQTPDHPVVCVNWSDARAYAAWLSKETGLPYRLPSEAEWEYAAKAGTRTRNPWDGEAEQCRHANGADASTDFESKVACNDGHAHTAPVGSYEPNGYGLADVLGNVWEWTQDCWNGSFAGVPADGRAGERGDCGRRLQRGGSWADEPDALSATVRALPHGAGQRDQTTGFRVARALHATSIQQTDDPPPPGNALLEIFSLQGFFTDPAVLTRIAVRSHRWDDDAAFSGPTLRFAQGPFHEIGHGRESVREVRVCRDPETGLDFVFVHSGNTGTAALTMGGLYRVNPAAGNSITPVYETDFFDDDYYFLKDTFIAADGSCRGRALKDAGRALGAALEALTSGPPAQPDFDVPVGEPLALSPRRIANAAVREAFLAIAGVGAEFPAPRPFHVSVSGAEYGDETDWASWRIVQVFHTVFRGAPGALLVQDRRRQTWHAFYDYRFGTECEEDDVCWDDDVAWEDDIGWYYRSRSMQRIWYPFVRDDKLFFEACTTGCVGYDLDPAELAWFAIDLHAHTATRLGEPPDFAPDPEYFHPKELAEPDLAAIAREMSGPEADPVAADAERPTGRPATDAREATRRAEPERAAHRGARDEALRVGHTFRDPLRSGGEGPEMVVVPAGTFRMGCLAGQGCNEYGYEEPVHRVTIAAPFAVGVYEVTFAEWEACVKDGGCGEYRPDDAGWGRGRRPVIGVSWEDARSYVAWLRAQSGQTYRLLSEAEWEYVARAGSETAYSWGDEIGENRANCDGCGSRWDNERTAPVGSFEANAFGVYDVHGNVLEWVEDCWNGDYAEASTDGTAWAWDVCDGRVLRGGAWLNEPWNLRSANRKWYIPHTRPSSIVGFRVARTVAR